MSHITKKYCIVTFSDIQTYCEMLITFNNVAIISENVEERKVVSFANFIIVRVMCRCDLDSTSTKVHLYKVILKHW